MKTLSKLQSILQLSLLGFLCINLQQVNGFRNFYPKAKPLNRGSNGLLDEVNEVGEPLMLTPLLKAGKIEEAQKLAKVTNLTTVESYSGFFTVNEKYNSNLFFWFFPAAVSSSCPHNFFLFLLFSLLLQTY